VKRVVSAPCNQPSKCACPSNMRSERTTPGQSVNMVTRAPQKPSMWAKACVVLSNADLFKK
jgi:hypothetical protein